MLHSRWRSQHAPRLSPDAPRFPSGFLGALLLLVAGLVLAGCTSTGLGPGLGVGPPPAATTAGEVLGTGSIKVALLLPLSATGNAGQLAANLRNAAALALQEYQGSDIQILVKDDRGTPDGARAAATEALGQGVELILGPLFAQSVAAAGQVARPAGVPVVAFSTDSGVAAPGVYLLSFLPQSDVSRIISYAAGRGKKSIAALLPDNAYGTVVEAALRQVATRTGARVVAIEKYALDRGSMQAKAQAIANVVKTGIADAVFLPDGGDAAPFLAQTLAASGVRQPEVQFLGSGQWNDTRVLQEPALVGGWFPAPDDGEFQSFSARYNAAFGGRPIRLASLGYDATILAAGLAANFGAQRFATATLTNPNGFRGMDGAFRFLSNGTSERALAIYQVTPSGANPVEAAPASFAAGL